MSKPKDQGPGHKYRLSHQEAEAGSAEDSSVCGEEDPGAALEFLVEENRQKKLAREERNPTDKQPEKDRNK